MINRYEKKMGMKNGLVFALLFGLFVCRVFGADDTTTAECGDDFQKVMTCLDYATGKITTPSKECCSSVKGIKDSDPKCLCYIIQQAHTGSDSIKNFGVQEAKLLQLPSACQLQNASITNCPKLLGLSPSSPDAAIFSNGSSAASPAGTGASTSPSRGGAEGSSGTMHGPYLVGPTVTIAMAIFFCAFSTGFASLCV